MRIGGQEISFATGRCRETAWIESGRTTGRAVMSEVEHRIFVCTSCRHQGRSCLAGYRMIRSLETALKLAGPLAGDDFEISGTASFANCTRPCIAAFRATVNAIHFFGDVAPDADIDDLVRYSEQFRDIAKVGNAVDQVTGRLKTAAPDTSSGAVFERLPAAVIVSEAKRGGLS
jgi:predicted metal-binding protein